MEYLNRVIPVLTIASNKLIKTVEFNKPKYIGDPINAVKIFNDKMVDEVVLLDITATKEGREPNYDKIQEICGEAFMPFAYGGGISRLDQIEKLFSLGIEKVVLNSILSENIELISKASSIFGSQSIVASVDVKKNFFGRYNIFTHSAKKKLKTPLNSFLHLIEKAGAGEVFLNSINRDGTFEGYDLELIQLAASQLSIPLVACGGAGSIDDLKSGIRAGASAVAASSIFVFKSKNRGILINYPDWNTIQSISDRS